MLTDTTKSPYAKVHALDGMKVKWTGGLWKERFDTCANSICLTARISAM